MAEIHNRRASDQQIIDLINRVEELDNEVKKLRSDFDDHTKSEAVKIEMLSASLVTIQVKLDQLLIDIKEPIDAYKTAKAGMSFLKFMTETAKWLVPLCFGLWLGFSNPINTNSNNGNATTSQQTGEKNEIHRTQAK